MLSLKNLTDHPPSCDARPEGSWKSSKGRQVATLDNEADRETKQEKRYIVAQVYRPEGSSDQTVNKGWIQSHGARLVAFKTPEEVPKLYVVIELGFELGPGSRLR